MERMLAVMASNPAAACAGLKARRFSSKAEEAARFKR